MNPTEVVLTMDPRGQQSQRTPMEFNGLSVSSSKNTLLDGNLIRQLESKISYSVGYTTSLPAQYKGMNPAYVDETGFQHLALNTRLLVEVDASDAFIPKRNNIVQTVEKLHREWRVTFDIMPYSSESDGWLSVAQVTTDTQGHGYRAPDVYFKPSTGRLRIQTSLNGNADYTYETTTRLPVDQWSYVEISQMPADGKFSYSIKINGVQVHSIENTDPLVFPGVINVYAGNDQSEPAPVWMRLLRVHTEQVRAQFVQCENFDQCSKTCGGGSKKCAKTCWYGSVGDQGCSQQDLYRTQSCNNNGCPYLQDCYSFDDCSKTCGGGTQSCTKTCVDGNVGDVGCASGDVLKEQTCNNHACIEPDQWREIFSQTTVGHDWSRVCQSESHCTHTFDQMNFIDFAVLKDMPMFDFKFVYTDVQESQGGTTGITYSLGWKQMFHPMAQTDTNIKPTSVLLGNGNRPSLFVGLTYSKDQTVSLFDGEMNGPPMYRFYAVGYQTTWDDRLPIYYLWNSRYTAIRVQLFVKIYG